MDTPEEDNKEALIEELARQIGLPPKKKRSRKLKTPQTTKPKAEPPVVEPITRADIEARRRNAPGFTGNRAPRIGGRIVLPREQTEADYRRMVEQRQQMPQQEPEERPGVRIDDDLKGLDHGLAFGIQLRRNYYKQCLPGSPELAEYIRNYNHTPTLAADGKRSRSAAQIAATEKMNEQRSLDAAHKFVQMGARLWGCSCGMAFLNSAGSRGYSQGAHDSHKAEVKRIREERSNNVPDCFS
jgi:hypothetical protein